MATKKILNSFGSWKLFGGVNSVDVANVLSALRGPDTESQAAQELKEHVTARIRAIVYARDFPIGSYNSHPLRADELAAVKRITSRMNRRNQQQHFLAHLRDAVNTTLKHPVWGGLGQELYEALA